MPAYNQGDLDALDVKARQVLGADFNSIRGVNRRALE